MVVSLPSAVCNLGSLPPVYMLCGLCLWLLKSWFMLRVSVHWITLCVTPVFGSLFETH